MAIFCLRLASHALNQNKEIIDTIKPLIFKPNFTASSGPVGIEYPRAPDMVPFPVDFDDDDGLNPEVPMYPWDKDFEVDEELHGS